MRGKFQTARKLRISTILFLAFLVLITSTLSSNPEPAQAQLFPPFPPESFYVPPDSVILGDVTLDIPGPDDKQVNIRLYGPDHPLALGEVGNLYVVARFPKEPTAFGTFIRSEGIGDDFVVMVGRDVNAGIKIDQAGVTTEWANFLSPEPSWESIEAIRNFVEWHETFRNLLLPFSLLTWVDQLVFIAESVAGFLDWVDSLGIEHGQNPDREYWASDSLERDFLAFGAGASVSLPAYKLTIPYTMTGGGSHPGRIYVKLRTVRSNFVNKDEVGSEFSFDFQSSSPIRAGFNDNILPANDDGSSGVVALPFTLNFFGNNYGALFVNNNGNVTFDAPMRTFTPFDLITTNRVIIAPFFADVDTRKGNVVTYGTGLIGGQLTFGVNWINVGCYSQRTHVLNAFQLLLIDRSDINTGDFDILFNNAQTQWETGQASGGDSNCLGGASARVGYSNGTTSSFELPGSGINGAFLDSNLDTGLIHNSRNSFVDGRYVFEVRSGVAPTGGTISGTVFENPPLAGAFVQVCEIEGSCNTTTTNVLGLYTVSGLAAGQYSIRAFPPAGSSLLPGTIGPVTLSAEQVLTGQDVHLSGPTPPPSGTTITSIRTSDGGLPVVYWGVPLTLSTQGCAGGTASYEILQDSTVIRSGAMAESPAGTYTAVIDPLRPVSGNAHVAILINCPDLSTQDNSFDMYIDPSGTVVDQIGNTIAGATVTLLRSDSSIGPFVAVPDGSGIMSPANRSNPDSTDSDGHFGWDVIAGFYVVRAEAVGCVSPLDPAQTFVETGVLTIPPPVTDLVLVLDCNLPVSIDIKPGSDVNPINVKNKGVIPVAILTTDSFDATTVNHNTVVLEGATEVHIKKKTGLLRRHEEDVDGDGDTDLVFHFERESTDIQCGNISASLTGQTFDGQMIVGSDSITIVGCE